MKIPMCNHLLHPRCLKKWLVDFQKCPVCESNIVKLPDEQQHRHHEHRQKNIGELGIAPGLRDIEEEKRDCVACIQESAQEKQMVGFEFGEEADA